MGYTLKLILEKLELAPKNDFVKSLHKYYLQNGHLTEKQVDSLLKVIADKPKNKKYSYSNKTEPDESDYSNYQGIDGIN